MVKTEGVSEVPIWAPHLRGNSKRYQRIRL